MSRIFNFYAKNADGIDVDHTWYDSSNVKYSECLDHDNRLKTLRVVFANGTQYEYKDVNSSQYLLFREDLSQGKALNKYIKGNNYEYEKIGDANLEELNEELDFRINGGMFLTYKDGNVTLKDNMDSIVIERDVELNEDAFNLVGDALESVGKKIRREYNKEE